MKKIIFFVAIATLIILLGQIDVQDIDPEKVQTIGLILAIGGSLFVFFMSLYSDNYILNNGLDVVIISLYSNFAAILLLETLFPGQSLWNMLLITLALVVVFLVFAFLGQLLRRLVLN